MTYASSSNDKIAIHHDNLTLFGGESIRDLLDETQILQLANGELIQTNLSGSYRVVYKPVSPSYSGYGYKGIEIRDEYSSDFLADADFASNTYMLNWSNSRFNSISIDFWDADSNRWINSYKYSQTGGLDKSLPNRAISDESMLEEIQSHYGSSYYSKWEYQCALYNWQYPEGGSFIQYLFGNDDLTGTRLDDFMTGGAGNDLIKGGAGNDVLYGSYGADTIWGASGSDTIVFDGGSSVWKPGDTSGGAYDRYTIDAASGGTGRDFFVFDLPGFNFTGGQSYYPIQPDLYGNATGTVTNYNPYLSQSQNSTPFSTAPGTYNVSPLTFRTRVLDFKVGEDKLDLSSFGIDPDFITLKALSKVTGAAFITAANVALKPDGYGLMIGKSASTSNNTTLFIIEQGVDTNLNGKVNDTLVEIQLVGLTNSAISVKIFGDSPVV